MPAALTARKPGSTTEALCTHLLTLRRDDVSPVHCLRPRSVVASLVLTSIAFGATRSAAAQSSTPAARRDSAVIAVERGIWENTLHQRWEGTNAALVGVFTVDSKGIYTWSAANTTALRATGCTLTSYAMRDVRTRVASADVVVLGYRADLSLKCPNPAPSVSNNYLSVYRRRGTGWELVASSITPVSPPK